MATSSSERTAAETFRCNVCGREFETAGALEHHVRDQGLLW